MTEITSDSDHPTAQKPTGTTPPNPTPAPTVPGILQPTPTSPVIRGGILPNPQSRDGDSETSHSAVPTPAMPQPGGIPFLPKETGGFSNTNPSSRCSSVNPNDTLPPTPTSGSQPQPYPPQMRIPPLPVVKDIGRSTTTTTTTQEHEVRPTTHLPLDDMHGKKERAATTAESGIQPTKTTKESMLLPTRDSMPLPTPTNYHNALPSQPAHAYAAARSSGEMHPSGYRQNADAAERPYYGGEEENGEDTLLGKLGKWVEEINSKIVDSGIAGDIKGKGKE